MAGRIEVYIHSDRITPNKGMGAIEVCAQTDFATRTDEFIEFAKRAARLSYAASGAKAEVWAQVIEIYPTLEEERKEVEQKLGEIVWVRQIKIMDLTTENLLHAEKNGLK